MTTPTEPTPAVVTPTAPTGPPAEPVKDEGKTLTQADVDKIVTDRLKREREKFADYEDLKTKAGKLAAIEAAQLTDAEKSAAALAAAEKRNTDLTNRTVRAEVRALAAESFEDPSDAHLYLDLSKYVDAKGDIDADSIKADLAELLTKKAHLAKATGPARAKPDLDQGVRDTSPGGLDAQIAAATKAGNFQLAIALKQQRQASKPRS